MGSVPVSLLARAVKLRAARQIVLDVRNVGLHLGRDAPTQVRGVRAQDVLPGSGVANPRMRVDQGVHLAMGELRYTHILRANGIRCPQNRVCRAPALAGNAHGCSLLISLVSTGPVAG